MDSSRWASSMENLSLTEKPTKQFSNTPKTPSNPSQKQQQKAKTQDANNATGTDNDANSRDAALRAELESVRRINQVVEGVTTSLEKARSNMDTINTTVSNAHTLLSTWTRILSQTEHNQRLLLNPTWGGASADLADIENESFIRARDAERRAAEESERRAVAEERRRAEEERRRVEAEKREASASARARPGSRVGAGSRARGASRAGAGATPGRAAASTESGREGLAAGSGPGRTGRGAIAGYGRIGSVGTRAGRAAGP